MSGVRLQGLGHRFSAEGPWLFRDLTDTFVPGERCSVTGPSGSGKSTLLSIIAGWLKPAEGDAVLDDIAKVQWVFQNPHGVPRRAAIDHIALPLLAAGLTPKEADAQAEELCERVGLDHIIDRRPFSQLSGGEGQRLMLARALSAGPDLLLVDEPTAQLDRRNAHTVNRAIAAIGDAGGIVLVATHDAETAASCDRQVDLGAYAAGERVGS